MARVEIMFEDNESVAGGHGTGVTAKCTPDAKILFARWKRGESMSPAEAMALVALSSALRSSQDGELADRIRGRNSPIIL